MIKTNIYLVTIYVFFTFFLASCSYPPINIKRTVPDTSSSQSVASSASDIARSLYSNKTMDELSYMSMEHINMHIHLGNACGYYETSYGKLPQNLSDLLDGRMLAWPKCVYTNKIIKVTHTMPDPENPEDIGKVYYERMNDLDGYLYYLNLLDFESFLNGNPRWKVYREKVTLFSTANIPPGKEQISGYMNYITEAIDWCVVGDSIERTGTLGNSFESLVYDNGYLLFRNGIEKLRTEIANGNVYFDMGHCSGAPLRFYVCHKRPDYFNDPQRIIYCDCIGPLPYENSRFDERIFTYTCEDSFERISHISSSQFESYTFSDEVLIDPEDVL